MAKRSLKEPWRSLETEIIKTLIAGHHEWRPDLSYPQSHSDMQAAVRGLLQMFNIERSPLPIKLDYEGDLVEGCEHEWDKGCPPKCRICGGIGTNEMARDRDRQA